jgi:hypothetical protein
MPQDLGERKPLMSIARPQFTGNLVREPENCGFLLDFHSQRHHVHEHSRRSAECMIAAIENRRTDDDVIAPC